jgi:hypothetical protein
MEKRIEYNNCYLYVTVPEISVIYEFFKNPEEAYRDIIEEVLYEARARGYNVREQRAIASHLQSYIMNLNSEFFKGV